MKEFQRIKKVV